MTGSKASKWNLFGKCDTLYHHWKIRPWQSGDPNTCISHSTWTAMWGRTQAMTHLAAPKTKLRPSEQHKKINVHVLRQDKHWAHLHSCMICWCTDMFNYIYGINCYKYIYWGAKMKDAKNVIASRLYTYTCMGHRKNIRFFCVCIKDITWWW